MDSARSFAVKWGWLCAEILGLVAVAAIWRDDDMSFAASVVVLVTGFAGVLHVSRGKFQAQLLSILATRRGGDGPRLHAVPDLPPEAEEEDRGRLEAARSQVLSLLESARRSAAEAQGRSPGRRGTG